VNDHIIRKQIRFSEKLFCDMLTGALLDKTIGHQGTKLVGVLDGCFFELD